jgi:xanthine dehydrogenase accessory factor
MRDVIADVDRWRAAGDPVALATVVETWGSAPRRAGAKMAVAPGERLAGSVSGGCVEGAVVQAAAEVLAGRPPRLLRFGVTDAKAWEVGLSCGGTIEVFLERLDEEVYEPLRSALLADRSAAVVTVVRGPGGALGRKLFLGEDGAAAGSLGGELDESARRAAREALAAGESRRVELTPTEAAEPVQAFVEVHRPPPVLVMVGGVHVSVALTAIARTLGYRTVVVDPRRAFGSADRFPHADRLVTSWPDEALAQVGLTPSTAVAVLTHDPKLDDPALTAALPSTAFYVGALGSRATQEKRRKRLLAAGLTEAQISRLHAPIGLDLGGRSPEEIALAVMAEVVAAKNGRPSR